MFEQSLVQALHGREKEKEPHGIAEKLIDGELKGDFVQPVRGRDEAL